MFEKDLHFSVYAKGADVDKLDIMSYLDSLPEDWAFEVTSFSSSIYNSKIDEVEEAPKQV